MRRARAVQLGGTWGWVAGPTVAFAGASLLLGLAVEALGVEVPVLTAGAVGAVLGLFSAPPVRSVLERHSGGRSGLTILALSCLLLGALLSLLGLAVLVPAVCVTAAVYAVVLQPARRRVVESTALAVATPVLCLGAQTLGWVSGFLSVRQSVLAVLVLLVVTAPSLLHVARTARRAQQASAELELQRQRHLEHLEHAARHEPATGLLNRRGLAEALTAAVRRAGPTSQVALLAVDLDGFTAVNDVHGHAAGDLVLVQAARRLERCAAPDGAVARTGADEFVLLLRGLADPGRAAEVAAAVRRELAVPVLLADGSRTSVGASVGVACSDGRTSVVDLVAGAEAQLRVDRRGGRPLQERLA